MESVNNMAEEKYEIDIQKKTQEVEDKLQHSNEVMVLANQIDIAKPESISAFGHETAHEISKFADKILATIQTTSVEDSGQLLIQLNKIMDRFDSSDFSAEEKKAGLLSRLFKKTKDSIDSLFQKYNTMGNEMDKVYVQLKEYESEVKNSNSMLDDMFGRNMDYYEILEKYILAGKKVLEDIQGNLIPDLKAKAESPSASQIDHVNLSNALQIDEMMQQRIFDLELAKNVSLQTMPQIKMIQKGNYNLVRKINSAFIVTIPIFKQSLIQAITLKRQAIQAKAMAALDEKTNELLLKNAENTALQSKLLAQLSGGSSINVETLEKSWQTIIKGIEETKQIQEDNKRKREEGSKKLQEIQDDFKRRAQSQV
ncbi:Uncharacterized conserved protein YaaN involved in tellurite resistance [Peptoclostridium litorale DSM 5388]|uniref:Toxic anion resistance protein, tela family n=1 Tax=Peptoclostridium litorale DSM 5388 TaxID=1121324 RepID=A0A069RAC1_PEPLI|nr:toxic anion resistance protein [Peptoclostridium litorale]KDR93996.1 toxic anion resistance protein, tela family [Peptoclostridium litorale DSM 5388]SIN79286.1 Uncharacterized conserved protein YaaN involved in tellurite resistance [Peptoclostridium litorale DSM 5388]